MAKVKQLGKYRLVKKIARGGMGAVYEAVQQDLDRPVAVKVLPQEYARDTDSVERFRREAQSAARLNHPNIVTIYEIGQDRGIHFFSMELVRGVSLEKRLYDDGVLTAREAVGLMSQAVHGLGHAWQQNVIHRDLKPANLLLTPAGQLKIADFGLAKLISATSEMTHTSDAMGTPYYASPEQGACAKSVDHRTDIYSLGATFYHLLTGRVPFYASSPVEVAIKRSTTPLTPLCQVNAAVPANVATIVEKMMARAPEERYQDAAELLDALSACGIAPKPVHGNTSDEPQSAEAKRLVKKGLRLADRDQKAEAFAYFDKATELAPTLAEAWLFRGLNLHHVRSDYMAEMLDNLRRAVALDPKYNGVYESMLGMEGSVRQQVSTILEQRNPTERPEE